MAAEVGAIVGELEEVEVVEDPWLGADKLQVFTHACHSCTVEKRYLVTLTLSERAIPSDCPIWHSCAVFAALVSFSSFFVRCLL